MRPMRSMRPMRLRGYETYEALHVGWSISPLVRSAFAKILYLDNPEHQNKSLLNYANLLGKPKCLENRIEIAKLESPKLVLSSMISVNPPRLNLSLS